MATECMENPLPHTFSNIGKMNLPDEMMPMWKGLTSYLTGRETMPMLFLQWGSKIS